MSISVESLSAWLETQERMLRAWCAEASLDPGIDDEFLDRLERHCAWLGEQVGALNIARADAERVQ